jgi:hypothetical protein
MLRCLRIELCWVIFEYRTGVPHICLMSTSNRTASASGGEKLGLAVRFSREFPNGLFVELQAIDPLDQQSRTEPIGLLFGLLDDTSVRLEKFEPLHLGKSNQTDLLDGEAAEEVLEKARLQLPTHLAVTGWYKVRTVGVHNRCFKSDRDVMLIVRLEPTGRLTLELYTAKPDSLLATHEHRRGWLQVASADSSVERVEVSLTSTVDNKLLLLKAYEVTKSLDRAEFQRV